MLSLEEARDRLLARAVPTDGEELSLSEAGGRVLLDPTVRAAVDVPAFSNSAMDGYAVRAADTPGRLSVVGEVTAGVATLPTVEPGTTVRIMTGAPIPPGADAVVPIEVAEESDGVAAVARAAEGDHVRPAAHDTRVGDEVTLRGPLTAARIAVLASLGLGTVIARRRPRVAILSTGDELAAPGVPLGPHQVHDANGVALAQAVRDAGGDPIVLDRARDDRAAVERALAEAAARGDLVVASAGVSVGRHDHVRGALEALGTIDFWRIRIQPGKPLAVGEIGGTTVIGLPGNPVSALVVFELFVRPLIRRTLGLSGDGRVHLVGRSEERITKDRERRAFLRVVVSPAGDGHTARPAGGQGSSQLRPLAAANALLIVPEGADAAEAGASYEAILLEPLEDPDR
jgi:molybdopterin molybdotransferase